MAKKDETAGLVSVVLTCIYSGLEETYNPGDILETDADEAARLIEIGAAKAIEAEPAKAAE